MGKFVKLKLPSNFTGDQAQAYAETVKSALALPADARLNFQTLSPGPRGQIVLEYGLTQPVQIEGPDLGPANGVTIDVPGKLTLRFNQKGELVNHQFQPVEPRYLDAVRAHVKHLVARGEIQASNEVDAERAIAARKPYYLARDEQGHLRLRRAFIA